MQKGQDYAVVAGALPDVGNDALEQDYFDHLPTGRLGAQTQSGVEHLRPMPVEVLRRATHQAQVALLRGEKRKGADRAADNLVAMGPLPEALAYGMHQVSREVAYVPTEERRVINTTALALTERTGRDRAAFALMDSAYKGRGMVEEGWGDLGADRDAQVAGVRWDLSRRDTPAVAAFQKAVQSEMAADMIETLSGPSPDRETRTLRARVLAVRQALDEPKLDLTVTGLAVAQLASTTRGGLPLMQPTHPLTVLHEAGQEVWMERTMEASASRRKGDEAR